VTGGSRGLGKAIARELAREGVEVAIVARGAEALRLTAMELAEETGGRIVPIVVDTGQDESVKQMVRQAIATFGKVDILVNCAATPGGAGPANSAPPKLAQITDQLFFEDMNVKVMGYVRCAREVAPSMIQSGWGRIVNVSGLNARNSGNMIGSTRNVAVVAMTKNLADELGPQGINVTVVHPGLTRTERTDQQAANEGVPVAEVERRMADTNSVHKTIDARDIAYVVTMLCSPRSIAMNGDVIAAGGGLGRGIYY
jgi:NAD(P)-dependent dehydrogenase (short-subunit alcohol dehydrogenase family)